MKNMADDDDDKFGFSSTIGVQKFNIPCINLASTDSSASYMRTSMES